MYTEEILCGSVQKDAAQAEEATKALREMVYGPDPGPTIRGEADFAVLMITPSSGEYFNATPGYLELDICDGKTVCNVDADGKPEASTHEETTLSGADRILKIAEAVHKNGGKVIANINFTLAWEGKCGTVCGVCCWQDLIRIQVRHWM